VESVVDVAAHATLESSLLSEFTSPFEDSMQMIARSSAGAGLACYLVALSHREDAAVQHQSVRLRRI
jgi:hypothetical protein